MDLLQSLRVCREAYELEEQECSLNLALDNRPVGLGLPAQSRGRCGQASTYPVSYREEYLEPTLTLPLTIHPRPLWRAGVEGLLFAVRRLRGLS